MPLIPAESGEFEASLCSKFQASQDPSVVSSSVVVVGDAAEGSRPRLTNLLNLGATVCTDISESLATQARRLGVGIRSGME